MNILYLNKEHTVSLTGSEYHQLDKKMPKLYYYQSWDAVYSNWEVKILKRLAVLFGLFGMILMIYYFRSS